MDISQTQKRGYIWLLAVLLILLATVIFWPSPKSETQTAVADSAETAQQDTPQTDTTPRYGNNYKRNRHDGDYRKTTRDSGVHSQSHTQPTQYTPVPPKKPLKVAMNSADTLTWQLLYGIGPSYARRIVKYRELLGGYIRKEQLLEVYGFTPELYEKISPYVVYDEVAIRKMKINEITLKELSRHPYIDYYQARDIIDFRNRGHLFLEPSDLMSIPTMDSSTLHRLLPYLDFEVQ